MSDFKEGYLGLPIILGKLPGTVKPGSGNPFIFGLGLALGLWDLGLLGSWDFGTFGTLAFGTLDLGLWTWDLGTWHFGLWTLDFGTHPFQKATTRGTHQKKRHISTQPLSKANGKPLTLPFFLGPWGKTHFGVSPGG